MKANAYRAICAYAISLIAATCNADTLVGLPAAVPDGDTFPLVVNGDRTAIRLEEIDAPEKRQRFAAESGRFLSDLLHSGNVRCERRGLDRYGRSLATCFVGALNVNEELVRGGMAWVFRKYVRANRAAYLRLEADARRNRTGLWVDQKPTPPWEWRRRKVRSL